MMKKLIPLLACSLLVAATVAQAETVKLHGSTTCQKRIFEPGKDALKKATGLDLEHTLLRVRDDLIVATVPAFTDCE